MKNTIIAPSLLAANFANLENEIRNICDAGADWLHIDVMDGQFVPPITFGPMVVQVAKQICNADLDVHLMVNTPEHQIAAFVEAGADRITFHVEADHHALRTLAAIRAAGIKSGISLNPGTAIETVLPLLAECDLALIMSVNPGWGGQAFIPSSLERIRTLRKAIDSAGHKTLIQVDGGIDAEHGQQCISAGADVLVSGSYVFGAKDRAAAIASLRPTSKQS